MNRRMFFGLIGGATSAASLPDQAEVPAKVRAPLDRAYVVREYIAPALIQLGILTFGEVPRQLESEHAYRIWLELPEERQTILGLAQALQPTSTYTIAPDPQPLRMNTDEELFCADCKQWRGVHVADELDESGRVRWSEWACNHCNSRLYLKLEGS